MYFTLFLTGVLWRRMPSWCDSDRAKSTPQSIRSCWTCCRKDFRWQLESLFLSSPLQPLSQSSLCQTTPSLCLSITPPQPLTQASLPHSVTSATAKHVSVITSAIFRAWVSQTCLNHQSTSTNTHSHVSSIAPHQPVSQPSSHHSASISTTAKPVSGTSVEQMQLKALPQVCCGARDCLPDARLQHTHLSHWWHAHNDSSKEEGWAWCRFVSWELFCDCGLDGTVPCGGGLWSGLYSSGVKSLLGTEPRSVGLSRIYLWVMSAFDFLSNLII